MKKILALILALCFLFCIASCSGNSTTQDDPSPEKEETAPADVPAKENEKSSTPDAPSAEKADPVQNPDSTAVSETPAVDQPVKEESAPPAPVEKPSNSEPPKGEAVVLEPEKNTSLSVADYVKNHGEEFARLFADNYMSSTGSDCTCSIQASGSRMILKVCLAALVDLPEDLRESMQSAYDILGTSFKELFIPVKDVCSELSGVRIEFCEKDGDLIAGVDIEL